jgi:FlaA1/EpsC-like NDP-sugar epimerase
MFIDKITSNQRKVSLIFIDAIISIFTLLISFCLRFSIYDIPNFISIFWWLIIITALTRIATFAYNGIYTCLWRYASVKELLSLVKAITFSSIIIMSILYFANVAKLPESVLIIDWALNIIFIGCSRIFLRLLRDHLIYKKPFDKNSKTRKKLIIIGAGDAGVMIAREIKKIDALNYELIGFIDDEVNKKGQIINQVPILGCGENLLEIIGEHKIEEAIIAMPSAPGKTIRKYVQLCQEAKIISSITPGLYDIIEGKVSIDQLREVRIEDLLGRDIVEIDISVISEYLSDSTVLVTGAAGSIGSELCRQILLFKPKTLILLDHSENGIFHIDTELQTLDVQTNIISLVGDIKNKLRLKNIFSQYQPKVVFHAAAYKHVPLMQANVEESIQNNIVGTNNLLDISSQFNVNEFVLISTDKAVYTTNCMGASKRICEIMLQNYALKHPKIKFAAVRFGNVLGSDGSVIPIFQKQIKNRQPITITHPEITRFFMTIKEAVQLVIQAGALSNGGAIYILDMGEPVKIVTLAKDLISLSGLEIDKDIKINFVGLRPGEKLHEALNYKEEKLMPTKHKKIFVTAPMKNDFILFEKEINELIAASYLEDKDYLRDKMMSIVSMFEPKLSNSIYCTK